MRKQNWQLRHRNVSMAFAVGLFCAFIPVPFQMLIATALALLTRANIAISVLLVWVSNPITMPPIFYFCYLVGRKILGIPEQPFLFELSLEWWDHAVDNIWHPFLLGCLVMGLIVSICGYLVAELYWRSHLGYVLRQRRGIHNRHK